ncbi:MAG TPA: PhoU domain-containing protein [Acidimicrobiales bacterium]|nr:PhoU domain-containing protein [Acidimicrobiales bacterium]
MPLELRVAFHRNLEEIDAKTAFLFIRVSEAVAAATDCLLTGDADTAEVLVRGDAEFDALADEVEALAERQLTLQAPMGGDLRYLLSILRMVPELERSADLAEHIAARAASGLTTLLTPRLRGLVEQMGRVAVTMWRDATEAFVDRDAGAADRLTEADDELDTLHNYLTAELVSGGVGVSVALEMALVGRFYERLGDHAVHVSQRVRFLAGELGAPRRPAR